MSGGQTSTHAALTCLPVSVAFAKYPSGRGRADKLSDVGEAHHGLQERGPDHLYHHKNGVPLDLSAVPSEDFLHVIEYFICKLIGESSSLGGLDQELIDGG